MEALLTSKADWRLKTPTGHCAIHIAVTEKQTSIIQNMRQHNVDLDITNDFGETGIHMSNSSNCVSLANCCYK
jgi:hypothetical protein